MALTASKAGSSAASPSNSSRPDSDVSVIVEPTGEKKRGTDIELQRKMVPVSLVFSDSSSRILPPATPSTSFCSRIWGAINHGVNKVCFFHPSQNFKTKFIQTTYNGVQAVGMFGILQGISNILLSLSHSDNRPVAITCTTIAATVSMGLFAYTQGLFTDSVTYFKVFRHMFEAAFVSIGDLHRKLVEVVERVNTLMSLSSLRKAETDAQLSLLRNQIAALKQEVESLRKQLSPSKDVDVAIKTIPGLDHQTEQPQGNQQGARKQAELSNLDIESDVQFFKRVLKETSERRNFSSPEEEEAFKQKLHKLMQGPSSR